jgi:hypothetical protein
LSKGRSCVLWEYEPKLSNEDSKTFSSCYSILFWAAICVMGFCTAALIAVVKVGKEVNWFEALSTLFSAGAFIGMLVTLAWQRLELRANTQELADQADALEEQVEVMRLSALLQSLPELIRIERDNLRNWHPDVFGAGREVHAIHAYQKIIAWHEDALERYQNRQLGIRIYDEDDDKAIMEGRDPETHIRNLQWIIESAKRLIKLTTELETVHQQLARREMRGT